MNSPRRLRGIARDTMIALLVAGMALLTACGKEEPASTAATKPAKPAPVGGIGGTGFADNGIGGSGMSKEGPGGIGGTGLADRRAGGIGGTGMSEDRASGGTGLAEQPPGGIGGTGLADQRGGIGGTGLKDWGTIGMNGIGGTGIVGVVTGFGSILVNGIAVDVTAEQTKGLDVGDLVAIQADGKGDKPQARTVVAVPALEGPVQASDPDSGTLKVLGQRVHVTVGTLVPGGKFPAVGDTVRVNGLMRVNGTLEAANIEPGGKTARLSGTLEKRNGGWSVDNVPVQPGSVTNAQALLGKPVMVSGTWNGTALEAATLAPDPVAELMDRVAQVSVQGYLTSLASETVLMVGGTRLRVTATADIARRTAGSGGEPLVVLHGTVSANRTVTATSIRVVPLRAGPATGGAGSGGTTGTSDGSSGTSGSDNSGASAGPDRPGKAKATGNPWGGPPASPPKGPPDKSNGKGGCGSPPCGKGKGKS
ncbi:MAG TPA: DUF5666 domain-containing protein [bacterium]